MNMKILTMSFGFFWTITQTEDDHVQNIRRSKYRTTMMMMLAHGLLAFCQLAFGM
jgi:hypothetical protein